ncbi:MAG: hypothetical protein QN198_00100 [Armatimonadota bacterium]|nr:hypothetical protein [Armatimonadota bacterium]MDR5701981.1 hypothetical protein [Armatimonadota bacterium]MDR7434721.1 hypothetical protein [Armatimonadota bacterium]
MRRGAQGILLVASFLMAASFPGSAHALSVPSEVAVEVSVTGRPASPEVIVEALLWEVRRALGLSPLFEPRLLALSGLQPILPGEEQEVTGVIRFAEREERIGEVMVRASVRNEGVELQPVQTLIVSNSPERIPRPGVLFPEVTLSEPVRILFHHKNGAAIPVDLLVKVRSAGPKGSKIHLIGGVGRAGRDELRSGHQAMRTYLARIVQGTGYWVSLPSGEEVAIAAQRLNPGHVTSGILQLQISGDPIRLWVEAAGEGDPTLLEEDGVHFRGVVKNPTVVLQGIYSAGEPPLTFQIGGPPFLQEEVTGRPLKGNYGVFYEILVTLLNPSDRSRTVVLFYLPVGGAAGSTLVLDGQIYEITPIPAFSEVPVATFLLGPQERRTFVLKVSPQAGSWYPVRLELRTIP